MYTYRQIFLQAWKVAINNPAMWFFGLFAALLGSANGLEMILGSYSFSGQGIIASFVSGLAEGGLFTFGGIKGLAKVMATNPLAIFLLAMASLLLIAATVFLIWLVTVSLAALVAKAVAYSKNKPLTWSGAMQYGISRFWPVLSLIVVIRLIAWLIIMAVVGLSSLLSRSVLSLLIFIVGFDLLLGLTIVVAMITNLAICGVVLKNWTLRQGLAAAWNIFQRHWLLCLEISIILFLISISVNSFLWFFLAWALYNAMKFYLGFPLALLVISLVLILIFVAVEILLTVFQWSVWALIFEILTNGKKLLISRLQAFFSRQGGK